ncbi:MAG TPA: hypothetical protein VGK73_32655 [Polyangiaceae bacterium]
MSTESKLAIERLRMREEMRSVPEEELSDVIEQEARKRVETHSSTPAPAKGIVAVLHAVTGWKQLLVVLALLAVIALAITRGMRLW